MARRAFLFGLLFFGCLLKAASQLRLQPPPSDSATGLRLRVLPQNFYNQRLPFSCRQELRLQQALRLPLYLRLGSKDATDRLEGKGHH